MKISKDIQLILVSGLPPVESAKTMIKTLKAYKSKTFEFEGEFYCWKRDGDGFVLNKKGEPLDQTKAGYIESCENITIEYPGLPLENITIAKCQAWVNLYNHLAGRKVPGK